MNIENSSIKQNLKVDFKGKNLMQEANIPIKSTVSDFYKEVRQTMPLDLEFDDITHKFKQDGEGEYVLSVVNYRKSDNTLRNNLKIGYIPNGSDSEFNVNLAHGTKQEILDYLGNEKNLDEIKFFMQHLKHKADLKD